MKQSTPRRSPLAFAILGTLYEEPMHPYRIQQLIKERGKDQVVNVQQRASIYQTIERLDRAGLIEVADTTRDERWPERTIYRLTDDGRLTVTTWLREMLSTPTREFPEFPAALAFLPLLTPEETLIRLKDRIQAIKSTLNDLDQVMNADDQELPRLFLIESEYQVAVLQAELNWVQAVVYDLQSGRLTWSTEWLRQVSLKYGGHEEERRHKEAPS